MMAIVVNGDACKPEDVEKAFAAIDGVDAVVTTIGGTTADPTADSQVGGRGASGGWGTSRPAAGGAGRGLAQWLRDSSAGRWTRNYCCTPVWHGAGQHQPH